MALLIGEILENLNNVKRSGNEYTARCPGHDDEKNSLSISEGNDKRVLLFCHAGCAPEHIVQSLGLKMSDLFPEEEKQEKKIAKIYKYTDIAGNILHETIRYEPKGFTQRRPDGKGGYIYNLQGIETVLYKLPEVIQAVQQSKTVYIVEGEKDAENMGMLGLAATTSPMGAGKWKASYSDYLINAHAVILPDNDRPGKEHTQQIAKALYGKAKTIKVVELPGLPEKGDITDFLKVNDKAKSLTLLQELIDSTEEWKPPEIQDVKAKTFKLSEFGNAERLVARYGENIRYCHEWNKWLVWSDTHWELNLTGEIERKAKETVRNMYTEAAQIQDEDQRAALAKHAARSETNKAITSMVELAKSELGIPVTSEQLDKDTWVINCINGTLNLKTGTLQPHNRNDYITKLIPINYDPAADFTVWSTFLNRIMAGNTNLISFLQRSIGYSLTGSTQEQCLFMPYGGGANGKSTFLETIAEMLCGYAQRTPTDTLMAKDSSGVPNDIARLKGSRFVIASEVEEGKRLAESLVKQLTGSEKMTARFMRAEFFEFTPQFKLWIGTNHKPVVRGSDLAIWRRIKLIPFNVTIPPGERDKDLPNKLRNELSGILNWAVIGCLDWQKYGLGEPEEVIKATEGYKEEMDVLIRFVSDCCNVSTQHSTKSSELYRKYTEWSKENGEFTLSQTKFSNQMKEKGFTKFRVSMGNYWNNIEIIDEETDFDENPFKG